MSQSEPLLWAPIPSRELNLWATFRSGQTFRWREIGDGGWLGVMGGSAVRLRAGDEGFWWQTYPTAGCWDLLSNYFALDVGLTALYADWIAADPRTEPAINRFSGLRI